MIGVGHRSPDTDPRPRALEGKLEWDSAKMRFTNNNEAQPTPQAQAAEGFTINS